MEAGRRSRGKKKVLIVDDHPVVRNGIKGYLCDEEDMTVCGEAEDVPTALAAVEKFKPDVVLVDISLGGRNGLELIEDLKKRHPSLPTLVLSIHWAAIYAHRALDMGASGYVEKGEDPDVLVEAIRTVLRGGTHLNREIAEKMLGQLGGKGSCNPVDVLSPRQLEIFSLMGCGYGTKAIAERLHIERSTVESHRTAMKETFGIRTCAELKIIAVAWSKMENEMRVNGNTHASAGPPASASASLTEGWKSSLSAGEGQ